ncbi:hypothetical protein KXD97_19310 [Mycobacterium sp. SMC-8]|uniref:hypothetical protein n=1 Tax=Mycobacterium sp. SMC-8 TaxID=2857060 RepID=UPI0021B15DAE|nr:hypothetical protein [Mycobacterium sp. SMC-8]UXA10284.1 hypothetical protein KXD97_19310 [Mycobacterium sp. SMC-8]
MIHDRTGARGASSRAANSLRPKEFGLRIASKPVLASGEVVAAVRGSPAEAARMCPSLNDEARITTMRPAPPNASA